MALGVTAVPGALHLRPDVVRVAHAARAGVHRRCRTRARRHHRAYRVGRRRGRQVALRSPECGPYFVSTSRSHAKSAAPEDAATKTPRTSTRRSGKAICGASLRATRARWPAKAPGVPKQVRSVPNDLYDFRGVGWGIVDPASASHGPSPPRKPRDFRAHPVGPNPALHLPGGSDAQRSQDVGPRFLRRRPRSRHGLRAASPRTSARRSRTRR